MRQPMILYKISIGELKEVLHQLKTKEDAVHAGLSVLSEHQNLGQLLKKDKLLIYLNNNWLIVQEAMEIKVAMVVLKFMLSNMLKIKDQSLVLNILMLLEIKNAKLMLDHSKLLVKLKVPPVLSCNKLWINSLLMLLLMLVIGVCIDQVS